MSPPVPKACIIGHPVAHSRSPRIHGFWLKEYGLAGAYERADVLPEALGEFLSTLRQRGFVGANVTGPHKEAVFRAVPHKTDAAVAIGAVNTLWFEGNTLRADNTDVTGFLANLDATAPGWDAHRGIAVVLGAGGAARAVLFGLIGRGFARIVLVNRTPERAGELATAFGPKVAPTPWEDRSRLLAGADLLVNTTTLGMHAAPPLDIELGALPARAVVNDIVYVPLETRLLAAASQRGLRAVDGLGMLLHQAVPGFARWFGVTPSVTEALRRDVAADILAR
jgi:shikimate dehydrogenase